VPVHKSCAHQLPANMAKRCRVCACMVVKDMMCAAVSAL
jgi:hypothetical protein